MPINNQQNWNNLVTYVKRKLGSPLALLEYTDDDIRQVIVEDVLPAMSQYIGKPIWLRLTGHDKIVAEDTDVVYEQYRIPIPDDIILVDIQEVYYNRDNMGTLGIYQNMLAVLDPRDAVMTNEFLDMLNSLEAVQAFEFIPPNIIRFERALYGCDVILECKAQHTDLNSVPSDYYQEILKPWCVAEVMENIGAMRSKYRTINTPSGQIELNYDALITQAQTIKTSIQDKLDSTPPDHLVHIF